MPVNMVSHAHGQGYADLHFLIPEVYQELTIRKGPYFLDDGNFATAGSVSLKSADMLPESQIQASGGSFNAYRGLWLSQLNQTGFRPIIAVEGYSSDGPFDNPENLRRMNLFLKNKTDLGPRRQFTVTGMGYASTWNASGQIPLREVNSGNLSRFGSIDPSDGGQTQRYSLSFGYKSSDSDTEFDSTLYLIRYRLNLYSDFTFFTDPVNGDQILQDDARTIAGFSANQKYYYNIFETRASTLIGLQIRNDDIKNVLYKTKNRKIFNTVVSDTINETNMSGYLGEDWQIFSWLRFYGGGRVEHFVFQVDDALEDKTSTTAPVKSGDSSYSTVLPKASLIITPVKNYGIINSGEFYLNTGIGLHSNDARGTVILNDPARTPVTPADRAYGYEAGSRWKLFRRLELAVAAWLLDLDGEIVWVGDEGTTEVKGKSRRYGVDSEIRWEIINRLFADADMTVNTAKYTGNAGNGNAISLAPLFTAAGGLSLENLYGFSASVRFRHIANRPANESGTLEAEGFFIIDANISYRYKQLEIFASARNLLNTPWKEVQFATTSQLPSETTAVEDIHFVPGSPLAIESGIRYYF